MFFYFLFQRAIVKKLLDLLSTFFFAYRLFIFAVGSQDYLLLVFLRQLNWAQKLRGFAVLSIRLFLTKPCFVIDIVLRKEIFQEHNCDVSLSGASFKINDVPVAHPVIRPIASYPIVDA